MDGQKIFLCHSRLRAAWARAPLTSIVVTKVALAALSGKDVHLVERSKEATG
jgi:hypothetical protein